MEADEAVATGVSLGGLAAGAAISLVPIVGGPASAVIAYLSNIPAARRVDRILSEIQEDIRRISVRLEDIDPAVTDSEEFNAALMRVIRVSLETADEAKRASLRHALLNGYILEVGEERDQFLALVAAYEPWHITVLSAVSDLMQGRGEMLDSAATQVARHLGESLDAPVIRGAIRDLAGDGLLNESVVGRVKEQNVGHNQWTGPKTESRVVEERFHSISKRGTAFLAFIADPDREVAAAGGGS